jgi:mono/diheme cytochrome c family protein
VDEAAPLYARFECNRCHDGLAAGPAPRDKHCVHCHQQILGGTFVADADDLERWRGHIKSITVVPSLAGARRLRRAWVEAFLLAPHDVRPNLPAMMPRLAIQPAEAKILARSLVPDDDLGASAPAGDAARGEALYRTLGCGTCHRFTGAAVDAPVGERTPERQLAPDLRHARTRVQPAALAAWIRDPSGSLMPRLAMSADDARALAAFVTTTPLADVAMPPAVRLPRLERPVGWDEVAARVFRKLCWHCHSQPDYAVGDGGPGNSGGFGFAPRGLDLSTANGAASGSFGDDGRRRSVFKPVSETDPTPRLLAHLLARQVEERGGIVPGIRGMPLGLPSISPEDIQLIETWIAQGRPR